MRRTISFKGQVKYIVERRRSLDYSVLYDPNVSDYEWKRMNTIQLQPEKQPHENGLTTQIDG